MIERTGKAVFTNADPSAIFNKIDAVYKAPEKFDDVVLTQLETILEKSNKAKNLDQYKNDIEQLQGLLARTIVNADVLRTLSFDTKAKINLKILERIKSGLMLYIEHLNRRSLIFKCFNEIRLYPDKDSGELRKMLNDYLSQHDNIVEQGLHGLPRWFLKGNEFFGKLKKMRFEKEKHFAIIDFDTRSDHFLVDKKEIAQLKKLLLDYVYQNPNIVWGKTFAKANELTLDITNQIDQKAQQFVKDVLDSILPGLMTLDTSLNELKGIEKIVNNSIPEATPVLKKDTNMQKNTESNQLGHETIITLYQKINDIKNEALKSRLLNTIEPFCIDPNVENIFIKYRDKNFAELGRLDAMMRIEFKEIQFYLSRFKPLSEAQFILKEEVLKWLTDFIPNKDKYKTDDVEIATQLALHFVQTLYRAQEAQCDDDIIPSMNQMYDALQTSSHEVLKKKCTLFIRDMEDHGLLSLTKDHSKRNFNPPSVNNYAMTDDKHLQLYALETSKLMENVPVDRHGNVFKNLLLGYKNLVIAAQLGNVDAKDILGERILSTDQNETVNRLYFEKLKTYPQESKLYQEAQFKLAFCYYSKRYQHIYTKYEERLHDLYLMVKTLHEAGDISRELCQALQINQAIDKEGLQLSAYKLLVLELAGQDPLAPLFPNHTTTYPFQYSEAKLKEILESGYSKREDKDKFISDFVRNQKTRFFLRTLPCVKENDGYTITIKAEKFDHVRETNSFIDPVSHEEIARLINENGVIHFVGFKDHLNLKIDGALTGDNYIFDNADGDVKLACNFNAKNNLNIIAHTKTLDFKGNINSQASINLETSDDLNLAKETTIICDKSLNLSSVALQSAGKIKAESVQIALDQSLTTSADSEIKANNILLTASALNDLRGAINADDVLQIRSADGINLNGKASLSAKKQLYLKAKSMSATDESSVKSDKEMYVITDDSITIDKESAWNADEIVFYSKVVKNNSSHLQFDKALIHANDKFTNSLQGRINTKAHLSLTGNYVVNFGKINIGEHLYVNINKLFANGYSEEQSLSNAFKDIKPDQPKGIIEGKDVSIVAANYINLGRLEIRNLDVTGETALNAGVELTADNRKTAIITDNAGMEQLNLKECGEAIDKFNRFIRYYGTGEILENPDNTCEPETYATKLAKELLPINQKTSTSDYEDGSIVSGRINSDSLYRYTELNSEMAVKVIKRFKEAREEQALTKANIELVTGEKLEHSGEEFAKYNYSQVKDRIEKGKIYADSLLWCGTSLKTDEKSILNAKQMIIDEINASFHGKNIGNTMEVTAEQLHLAETSKTEMKELLKMEAKNITLDGSITTDKLFSHSKELTKANGPIKTKESKMSSDGKIIYNNQFSRTDAKEDGDKPSFTANAKEEVEYTEKSHIKWKGTTLTQAENIKEAGTKEVTHDINHASKEHEMSGETRADMVSNIAEKAILKGKYTVKDAFVLDANELQMKQSSKLDAEGHALFEIVNGVIEGEHNIKSLNLTAKERLLNRSHLKLHRGTIKASDFINENKIELADNEVELQVVFDGNTKQSQAYITKKGEAALTTNAKEPATDDPEFLGKVDTKALGIDAELFVNLNFNGDSKALNIYLKTKALKEQPHSSETRLNIDADNIQQTDKGSVEGEGVVDIHAKQCAILDGLFNVKQVIVDGGKVILKATIKGELLNAQAKEALATKGKIAVDAAFLKSDKEANLEGQLKVDQGQVEAPIINDDANTQFSKHFTLKADRLKMSHQSKTTGEGTLKIDAHSAEMNNVDAKEVDVTLDHIANPNDFLLQRNMYSSVHARESMSLQTKYKVTLDEAAFFPYSVAIIAPTIDVVSEIGGSQDLKFKTTEGDLRTFKNISAGKVLVLDAHNNFFNNLATLQGGEALFVHSGGDIINRAGTLVSPIYVQLVSDHGDIINEAIQYTVPGEYGPMQQYVPAYIYGGTGAGHEGYGLFTHSGGKIINDASVIHSLGSNYLSADKGLESIARYNQYLSYHKEWHNLWKDKESNEYKYQLQPAGINSVYGKNVLVSENGPIYFLSTEMFGKEGNELSAKGPINLRGLVLETKCEKDATAGLGLLRDHSRETHEVNVPTVVLDYDHTSIVSLSDINVLNASLIGGDLSLIGKNVYVSAPILNHSYEQESWGFDFSFPNLSQLPGYSMFVDAKAFKEGNAVEKLASAWNMGIDSVNTLNSMAVAATGKNPFLGLCAPSAEASYGRTHQKSNYQTLADNVGISRSGSMYIKADDTIAFFGVPVIVAGDASFNAKRFLQKSAALQSSSENDSEAVTVGVGLDAKPRFGAKASYSKSNQTYHINQLTQVGGSLETNFNEWEMDGANVIAGNWFGNVGKLRIITPLNTGSSMSASAEANTGGVLSANYSENDYAVIGTPSGILVLNNINGANDRKIHVGETYLKGGKILAEGENNYETDSLVAEDVNEHKDGHSFGFTACTGNEESAQAIPNVPVQLGYEHFRAKQRTTIYGKQGTHPVIKKQTGDLNTENADGHEVESNTHFNVTLKIPTGSISKGLETTRENINRARDKIKEKLMGQQIPAPIDRKPLEPKQQENKADDTVPEAPVKKSAAERLRERSAAKKAGKEAANKTTSTYEKKDDNPNVEARGDTKLDFNLNDKFKSKFDRSELRGATKDEVKSNQSDSATRPSSDVGKRLKFLNPDKKTLKGNAISHDKTQATNSAIPQKMPINRLDLAIETMNQPGYYKLDTNQAHIKEVREGMSGNQSNPNNPYLDKPLRLANSAWRGIKNAGYGVYEEIRHPLNFRYRANKLFGSILFFGELAQRSNPTNVDNLKQTFSFDNLEKNVEIAAPATVAFILTKGPGFFGRRFGGKGTVLNEGLHHLNPNDIRFTQPNVSPNFTNGGSVNDLIQGLRSGKISPYDLPPIQVVQKDGKLFSIDNRRLLAYSSAGIDKIPVEIVSLSDPAIAAKFGRRFDPILGQGNNVIVVNKANRNAALDELERNNMIRGIHRGY